MGAGSFGMVLGVIEKATGNKFALKLASKNSMADETRTALFREA